PSGRWYWICRFDRQSRSQHGRLAASLRSGRETQAGDRYSDKPLPLRPAPPVGCERALEQRESRFRSACACCLFRKSRLFAADFLDRLRPGSDLRCCSSLFEVSLSAAELFDCVPPGPGGCNAPLPKRVDWRSCNRQMSDRHLGACNVSASRTHVDLALDDRHLNSAVPKHVHQKHRIVSPTG